MCLWLLFVGGLFAAAEDAKQLEGTWQIISAQRNGQDAPKIKEHQIVLEREKFRVLLGDKVVYQGTYSIDTSKKPATIDFKNTEGLDKGQTWLGIYQLDKGMLTICDNGADTTRPRPTKFQSDPDSGVVVVVCKKVKP
jgi:uncharacterized protein (TIGR03067 family)